MSSAFQALVRRSHRTTSWSGGMTTELAIYPPLADYQQANYLWRLSTATVDAETSAFTSLPGISRTLMLIEGQLTLRHEGHYEKELQPFDQDHFDGGWTTHSRGRARDFNLMCAPGCEGELRAHAIAARGEHREVVGDARAGASSWRALYCVDGNLNLRCEGDRTPLRAGEILVVEGSLLRKDSEWVLDNAAAEPCHVIDCTIRLTQS